MKVLLGVLAPVLMLLLWIFFPIEHPTTSPKKSTQVTDNLSAQAAEIYKFNCSMCHGPMGQGNGPTVHALPVSPPDWTNSNWQNSVTDTGIKNAIVGGGTFIGRSDFMPPHPQFKGKPVLNELVKIVRKYGR
jgi:mono/diheme cytochrome c family protein